MASPGPIQDAFALRSQERTAKAISSGRLAREIAPVPQRRGDPVTVAADEHPRETLLDALARLRPLAPAARDHRQVQPRSTPHVVGLRTGHVIMGWHRGPGSPPAQRSASSRRSWASARNRQPASCSTGPGLGVADVDLIELNEAFASQLAGRAACLGLPDHAEHVNPNGGAIALDHPLGASGARSC